MTDREALEYAYFRRKIAEKRVDGLNSAADKGYHAAAVKRMEFYDCAISALRERIYREEGR